MSYSGLLKQSFRFLLLILVITHLFSCGGNDKEPPKTKVAVVPVIQRDVPIYHELVGQTIGSLDIAIRARVDGQILGLFFEEGQKVTKDQLLYTIDPKPFESNVVGVEGEVAQAETKLAKADADLKRIEPLAKINAVSQRDLDAAVASKGAAKAEVDTAKAKLEYSKIELGYTKIQSPIDGIIGITKARVGDYVGKDPNPIVLNVVSQTDPIHVRVTLSENDYLMFAKKFIDKHGGTPIDSREDDMKNPLSLILADGSTHKFEGKLHAVNSQIDPTTGTLTIEAAFPNPQFLVRPGQYAKLKFVHEVKKDSIVVWQRAVQELQDIHQVYVVTPENKVEIRQVRVGPKVQGVWVIEEGLNPDDRVIVEGVQRVRPDMVVDPKSPKELNVLPPKSPLLEENSKEE